MPATLQDIEIEQNADFMFVIDVIRNGVPAGVYIDGFTARMMIRKYKEDEDLLAEYTTQDGEITVNSGTSQVVVDVPSAQTEDYDWSSGFYDIKLYGNGKEWRIAEGRVTVSAAVTREA